MSHLGKTGLIMGLSILAVACGRKGPLIYPDMLVPAAPSAVKAQQSGSVVKLLFNLPDKDLAGRPVQGVAGVKINKRVNDANQKDVCRSCVTDYLLFRTLYLDLLPTDTQRYGGSLVLIDSDVRTGNVYSYRIVPFTADGVDGSISAVAEALMVDSIAAPVMKIESFPTEIKLSISSPSYGSGKLFGYNLYRWSATTPRSYLPLNREPVKSGEYVDTALERGVKYYYGAKTLVDYGAGTIAESVESQEVEGMLKDDE
jgi:predicted small lipoprotein YifL